jgi:hypothetical protein
VYAKATAAAQSNAIELRAVFDSSGLDLEPNFDPAPLTDAQTVRCKKMNEHIQVKPLALWVREANPLHQNKA